MNQLIPFNGSPYYAMQGHLGHDGAFGVKQYINHKAKLTHNEALSGMAAPHLQPQIKSTLLTFRKSHAILSFVRM